MSGVLATVIDGPLATNFGTTLGGYGLLLGIVGWLWRLILTAERRHSSELRRILDSHQGELKNQIERHATELARINSAHDVELRDVKDELSALRLEMRTVRADLDEERKRRFVAEEQAAKAHWGERE